MNLSPLHIWASMSPMSKVIASFLILMAISSIGVVIERLISIWRSNTASQRFTAAATDAMDLMNLDQVATIAKAHPASILARAVHATIDRYQRGTKDELGLSPVERAKREAARQAEVMGADLRRGMGLLASVGSVAPFVGLLGTVVGIISAFQGIAATGSGGLGSVSAGIAEALVETALGLMVAIPAVLFFNFLTGRISAVENAATRTLSELLDDLENEHGRPARPLKLAEAAE